MTERVLGPTGSPRRRWTLLLPLVAALAFGLFYIAGAQAVHDLDLFELDRNALDDSNVDGDDWDTLYAGGANTGGNSDDFTGIVSDIAAPGDQFQGGGSKDNNDLNQWLWKQGEPLDKDDITNTYVAGYTAPETVGGTLEGDLIIYYGLDRLANNGTAQVGFWFFQDDSVGKGNTAGGGGFNFTGAHEEGDVLVQSNFTSGGRVSNVSVFEWVGSGGSNGTLDLLFAGQDCMDGDPNTPGDQPLLGDDPACATANIEDEDSPWPYTPKSGTANVFPLSSFFEGGVNISRLLRLNGINDTPCFPVFMAETRSSAPFDSRLKDFALGNFQLCEAGLVTTPESGGNSIPAAGVTAGTTVTDHAVVTGTGTGAPVPTGTISFFLCNPSELVDTPPAESPNDTADDTCATGGTAVDGATCDPAPPDPGGCAQALAPDASTPAIDAFADSAVFVVSTVGRWCWRGEYSATAGTVYDTNPSGVDETDASTGECFTVVTIPTTTVTAQNWTPNDTATITTAAPAGFNLTGSVRFRLYSNSTCSGTALYDQTVNIPASAGLTEDVKTTNGNGIDGVDETPPDAVITANGTYSWLVEYTPAASDTAHTGSSSVCHDEHSDLTIVNDDPNIPAP
jgi:hypothetical protein